MATINTVLGPLDTADMGFTLGHEHVMTSSAGVLSTFPELLDRQASIELAVRDLSRASEEGVNTIMDPTPHDQGRDVSALEDVSRRSRVNIIICTGTWLEVPRSFWGVDPDLIAGLYTREIEDGIEGTGIKAGFIKVANDAGGVTPQEETVLRAAARAQKRTGVPILTHSWAPERIGEQQIDLFEDEGVDMNRVSIGHSSDTTDLGYLTGLLRKGVWLGMDRNPRDIPGTATSRQRIETVKALIDAGWGHRIMLGHDWDANIAPHFAERRAQREANNPDAYLYITRKFVPALRELAASDDAIHHLTVTTRGASSKGGHRASTRGCSRRPPPGSAP